SGGNDAAKRMSPSSMQEQLLPLLQQEQTLLEDYGANHPQVQSVRRRIELTRKLFAPPGSKTENGSGSANGPSRFSENEKQPGSHADGDWGDPLAFYVQALKHELSDVEMAEQFLNAQTKSEYEEAKKLASFEFREEAYRNDIGRSQQLYESIIKRLSEF